MLGIHRIPSLPALRIVFALNAAGLSSWFPRIPDVKALLDVDLFWLSICFLMLPAGTFVSFLFATRLLSRIGIRNACIWIGPLFILCFLLPALAITAMQLGAALFVAGLAIAPIEVAMNAKASQYEKESRRTIMTSCHAFWSFGAMAGALAGGYFADADISFRHQQFLLIPVLTVLAFFVALPLDPDAPKEPDTQRSSSVFLLPTAALAGLCVLPMGALLVEGVMMEWSALFLRTDIDLEPGQTAYAFAAFAVGMASARLAGDRLAGRWGRRTVLSASALVATLGSVAFATAQGFPTAIAGAAILGLGVANIYPLALSLSANVPGQSSEQNIAAVAFSAFSVFLIGPPLIGTFSSLFGLTAAMFLLVPAAVYPVFMLRRMQIRQTKEI